MSVGSLAGDHLARGARSEMFEVKKRKLDDFWTRQFNMVKAGFCFRVWLLLDEAVSSTVI